ncbi:uncharacterized protein BO96DRAFT_348285 [Aspergillus niger CBS 101883]|uniref:Uncharacterized protein n=2 Tax=Aspergillus niger TaxID=5061 RepID=A2QJU6_ASPNC|nr:uncharacterized protein BO96DRAFT_348285 [Aspergillus niger CBS 101883]XP_059603687.1 hypothetical protein An04g08310 [Aspergillus niger]PYH52182.1 hypothetical protein BO96DRAFT_348285 [Aspergillus niger CBS 101883]CAK44797.1 hypothetical protein An04g08310 [Aspergillus niger]
MPIIGCIRPVVQFPDSVRSFLEFGQSVYGLARRGLLGTEPSPRCRLTQVGYQPHSGMLVPAVKFDSELRAVEHWMWSYNCFVCEDARAVQLWCDRHSCGSSITDAISIIWVAPD